MLRSSGMISFRALVLITTLVPCAAVRGGASHSANPIRRVVTMLQTMQKKVTEEGEADKELFKKFSCFCETGAKNLEASITEAEAKIPQVKSSLDEALAQKDQLEKDLSQHRGDRADAKEALAKASSMREKEAAEFLKESTDYKTNVAALAKAIEALEKGVGSFLQTAAADTIRRLTVNMDMSSSNRDLLASFLSQSAGQGYVPQSGQIIGILKQMKDTMEKDLADILAQEAEAKASFESLVAAKEKEIQSNTDAIEAKLGRHGQTGIEIETLKEDLEDTTKALAQDKAFLADMDKNCETKKAEYEAMVELRAQELLAIAETIKILNEDEALELFKKTLPSPSLLQVRASTKELRQQAVRALHRSQEATLDPRLDFLVLALRGKKVSFEKVLTMIDKMIVLLGEEQAGDDKKKAYCEAELDKNEDSKKELDLKVADLTKAIEEAEGSIATLTEEVSALAQGIKDLDAQVAEATENRKAEHAEYQTTLFNDKEAKEVLLNATNRLHQFYNPKLYKPPEEAKLTEEERIFTNMGGAGEDFFQITLRRSTRGAPPPPPEAFNAYAKKGQESTGVLEMIKMLIADLDKEMQSMEVDEKDAQAEYEKFVADSAAKRTADTKAIEEKESAKADLEAESQKMTLEKKSKLKEAMATAETIKDLHTEAVDERRRAAALLHKALATPRGVGACEELIQGAIDDGRRCGITTLPYERELARARELRVHREAAEAELQEATKGVGLTARPRLEAAVQTAKSAGVSVEKLSEATQRLSELRRHEERCDLAAGNLRRALPLLTTEPWRLQKVMDAAQQLQPWTPELERLMTEGRRRLEKALSSQCQKRECRSELEMLLLQSQPGLDATADQLSRLSRGIERARALSVEPDLLEEAEEHLRELRRDGGRRAASEHRLRLAMSARDPRGLSEALRELEAACSHGAPSASARLVESAASALVHLGDSDSRRRAAEAALRELTARSSEAPLSPASWETWRARAAEVLREARQSGVAPILLEHARCELRKLGRRHREAEMRASQNGFRRHLQSAH